MSGMVLQSERGVQTRAQQACLVAGLGSLLAVAGALACYALVPALLAALSTIVFVGLAAGRCGLGLMALATLTGLAMWTAFGTTTGYFLLNRHRLERLVADIEAVPAIASLELGQEGEYVERSGPPGERQGRLHAYDTYRFINGTVVTHFREQAAPDAPQPVLFVDDVLRSLHVPADRYWSLRRSLERLSLGGYGRDPDGQVELYEPPVGGQPWGYGYVFSPGGELSYDNGMQDAWRLGPHWFYILWG